MQVRLEVTRSGANVRRVVLDADTLIGRGMECDLRIASNRVSRQHCRITLTDRAVLVRDLASSNGTFVDGNRIAPNEDVPLSPGCRLSLGDVQLEVRFEPPSAVDAPEGASAGPLVEAGLAETVDFIADPNQIHAGEVSGETESKPDGGVAAVRPSAVDAADVEPVTSSAESSEFEAARPSKKRSRLRSLLGLFRRSRGPDDSEDIVSEPEPHEPEQGIDDQSGEPKGEDVDRPAPEAAPEERLEERFQEPAHPDVTDVARETESQDETSPPSKDDGLSDFLRQFDTD